MLAPALIPAVPARSSRQQRRPLYPTLANLVCLLARAGAGGCCLPPARAPQAISLHLLAIASKLDGMVRISTRQDRGQIGSLGEFIAGQRRAAQLSLRQLAEQTGISNPYLSQIERGLRKPSAEVLQQLAKALRVSAETLYVRAGILDPDDHPATSVEMAVLADMAITERQKRVLIDVYTSFVKENSKSATTEEALNLTEPKFN